MNEQRYKISDYATIVPYRKKYLIVQGITGVIRVIEKKFFDPIRKNPNTGQSPLTNRLKNESILVPDSLDEKKLMLDKFNDAARKYKITRLVLVLTMDCNFACPYCYEKKSLLKMSDQVLDRALDWFLGEKAKEGSRDFYIEFFGGEPLLCLDQIKRAVNKTREFCAKENLRPGFILTTNGALFDQNVADIFTSHRDLVDIQVTLDGTGEIHDKRRFYKNGRGSFNKIMTNLPLMLQTSQQVVIRINIDRENLNNFPALLAELEKYKTMGKLFLSVVSITNPGEKDMKTLFTFWKGKKIEAELMRRARSRGFEAINRLSFNYRVILCPAGAARANMVCPDGGLYPCESFLGEKDWCLGSVFEGEDPARKEKWMRYNLANTPDCLKCKWPFFCGGPCPATVRQSKARSFFCDPKNFKIALLKTLRERNEI